MDIGDNVQNENLVNDDVAAALSDESKETDDEAPSAVPMHDAPADAPAVAAPAEPADAPATDDAATPDEAPSAQPLATPAAPAEPEVKAEPEAEAAPAEAEAAPAEATPAVKPIIEPISHPSSGGSDEDFGPLDDIKHKALQQLSPLLDKIELPADEKFDTYMEVLRASDDEDLIGPAYDIAQQIEDEDKKAHALLEIVNEVNYLTQDGEDA